MKRGWQVSLGVVLWSGIACVPAHDDESGRYKDATQGTGDDGGTSEADAGSDPGDTGWIELDAIIPEDTGPPPPDRDGDLIPDDEDPAPTIYNNRLLIDTFDAIVPGDWIFSSVSMAIDGPHGQLRVEAIEPFEREGWIGPRPSWIAYYVRARLRITGVGTGFETQSGHVGLIARVNQVTPNRYLTCGIDQKGNRIVLAEHTGTDRITIASTPIAAPFQGWQLLTFYSKDGFHRCRIGGVEVSGRSETFAAGSVGFRSYDATFDADWIEVYEL